MKAWLVLLLGLLGGGLAHLGWYEWRRPVAPTNDVVAWMETELGLSPQQLARIRTLHEHTRPQLRELARRAAAMRAELAHYETERRRGAPVDFLAFARFVEDWRHIDQLCLETTQQLIAATADELTPAQRARYLDRVTPPPPRAS